VIGFLLSFGGGEEGYCSRFVLPTLPDTFMKGLFLQVNHASTHFRRLNPHFKGKGKEREKCDLNEDVE
jgi:hypothetical protein